MNATNVRVNRIARKTNDGLVFVTVKGTKFVSSWWTMVRPDDEIEVSWSSSSPKTLCVHPFNRGTELWTSV